MPLPTLLRFPGSKAKLLIRLTPFLDHLLDGRMIFHDVFTGGGAVALLVAERYPRVEMRLNDLDPDLSAFWGVVAEEEVEALCDRLDIRPTIDLFYRLRHTVAKTKVERAFQALFFSRCSFSGLLHGSRLGGESQMSENKVFARFNGPRLVEQIKQAHKVLAGRTLVTCLDGARYVRRHATATMYLDPPYFQKGDKLYRQRMSLPDHLALADALRLATNWLLSYDHTPVIEALYSWARRRGVGARYSVNGKKTRWTANEELVIVPPDADCPRRPVSSRR